MNIYEQLGIDTHSIKYDFCLPVHLLDDIYDNEYMNRSEEDQWMDYEHSWMLREYGIILGKSFDVFPIITQRFYPIRIVPYKGSIFKTNRFMDRFADYIP